MELVDEDIKTSYQKICPIIKHRHDEAKEEGIKTKKTKNCKTQKITISQIQNSLDWINSILALPKRRKDV